MKYPSVTPAQIQRAIASEHYFTAAGGISQYEEQPPEERFNPPAAAFLTTFCMLTLDNGFTVYGKSACAHPGNFDAELGRRYAREDAVRQVWQLLGFRLRDTLTKLQKARPLIGRIAEMGGQTFIGTKVVHAVPMNRLAYNDLRGWKLPEDENGADAGYLVQYADQADTNVPGFAGYISWSPAHVFREAYKEIPRGETDDESA